MKRRTILFIVAISAVSMIALVWLQAKWIMKGTELKNEQFNNHVEIAMWWTSEQLEAVIAREKDFFMEKDTVVLRKKLKTKTDSLINIPLGWFGLDDLGHFVQVESNSDTIAAFTWSDNVYRSAATNQLKENGLEYRLTFPEKSSWTANQLQFLLFSSILLILFIIGCFLITLLTLWRQKKIFEMTTDFISNMTHEFKTPITNVGFASNLLGKEKEVWQNEKAIKLNGIISEENKKLKNHVEQILNLARLEKGEIALNRVSFNLHEVIEESVMAMDFQLKENQGKIRCSLEATHSSVKGDKIHITNTIINLLDNANKYSLRSPEIIIRTYNANDKVVLSIADSGIGMSKENQKYVFQKFYRSPTGNLHDVKGFGLGLSYVKMVVDAHKGNIILKSEPGKGSCFEVFLPLAS